MIVQIVEENGQKKIVPLTADAAAGNPVGSLVAMYKKSSPNGYLYCDGSAFDQNAYPLLYAYLGTNVLPDYRECAIVGAEQNTSDTIETHDVYTEGQFKDDALQKMTGRTSFRNLRNDASLLTSNTDGIFTSASYNSSATGIEMVGSQPGHRTELKFDSSNVTRNDANANVTRGKRKAVYFYIKATSGLSENAQDNVVAQLNEERSYSTEEQLTGKRWIDGKPIYRKVVNFGSLPNNAEKKVLYDISNVSEFTSVSGIAYRPAGLGKAYMPLPYPFRYASSVIDLYIDVDNESIVIGTASDRSGLTAYVILEYTKTTD